MVLKRVGVVSLAKVWGILYAGIGLCVGAFVSLFAMAGAFAGLADNQGGSALLGMLFGAGAIVIMPVFYGILGLVVGMVGAALYNVVASLVGGIEVELE